MASSGTLPSVAALAHRRANRRGIRMMVAAMVCFVLNDTLVKYVSESLPAAQLIFMRGFLASVFVFGVALASGVALRPRELARGWIARRAVIDAVASVLFLVSLFQLPLANATAISMSAPLFITVLAVVLLRERVDAPRWFAIAVGFLGVVLVIRPGMEGFNAYALLCLAATLLHAVRDLATRRIAPGVSSLAITFATAVAVTLLSGVLSLFEGWRAFGLREFGLLATAAAFLAAGYFLVVGSVRNGDISVTAPWRYTGMLWAVLLGWAVWGHVPDGLAWAGIALLVCAGLYLVQRDRMRH
jgi:drug/metabolite transporter (DMT)-like permease